MSDNLTFSSFSEYFSGFCPHSLFYSFNGAGKTTLAGTTGLRTVLLDCGDAGVMSLRGVDKSKLKIIRITSTSNYLDVMEKVNRLADKIDLLVVDTLTGLQSMAIREVKGKRGEMSQRKWGMVGSKVIEAISETKSFPKDVIYLAQERRRSRDEGEGAVQVISPSLTPGVREALSSSVDWVGRLYVEDGKRKITFIISDTVEAKDRANLFPKVIVLPKDGAYLGIRKRIVEAIHA